MDRECRLGCLNLLIHPSFFFSNLIDIYIQRPFFMWMWYVSREIEKLVLCTPHTPYFYVYAPPYASLKSV